MSDRSKVAQALNEIRRTREGLATLEETVRVALAHEDELQNNLETENAALNKDVVRLRERNERLNTAVTACMTILRNARKVYVTLVTRDVLSDRSILHEIREEIDQIDEKIVQLREYKI